VVERRSQSQGRLGYAGLDREHFAPAFDRFLTLSPLIQHQALIIDRFPEVVAESRGFIKSLQGLVWLAQQNVGVAQIEVCAWIPTIQLQPFLD
jgi:hypothetical protein